MCRNCLRFASNIAKFGDPNAEYCDEQLRKVFAYIKAAIKYWRVHGGDNSQTLFYEQRLELFSKQQIV